LVLPRFSFVQGQESESSPEEPDQAGGSLCIVLNSLQFEWLTRQCEFLGISKQKLISDVLQEWICRNRAVNVTRDPSGTVQRALDEFMQRHRDEFLSEAD
jgi:hypothetical protein